MVSSFNGRGSSAVAQEQGDEAPLRKFDGNLQNFGHNLGYPSAQNPQISDRRDEISASVSPSRMQKFKNWLKNPISLVAFAFTICIAFLALISLLISKGVFNGIISNKSTRTLCKDAINQTINALATLLCLYVHPTLFWNLVLLFRWKPSDIALMRRFYCKNATPKPHERAHIAVVVILYHLSCFAQYVTCGLSWGYKRSNRPGTPLTICVFVAIGSSVVARIYTRRGPLGKDVDNTDVVDEESQDTRRNPMKKRFLLVPRNGRAEVDDKPVWRGGLFDVGEDVNGACLSMFCMFCVFGWNMGRIRFGDKYCQGATFIIFCLAPFLVFNVAAININNHAVTVTFFVLSVVLSVLGLLYGGVWRIVMRRRFKLSGNNSCFGKPDVSDCLQWLCCSCCSLAQEVRTIDFYDIVIEEDGNGGIPHPMVENPPPMRVTDDGMKPPTISKIQRNVQNS
ncbi:hypothetical protein Nepgr_024988 [Nepenthes gracilis]|uniref:PLAC8 family protein n=1 Tax=Nepenthes gracilis TaxID=150966 RepID=A0AAD3Y0M2_NEPGR|nr:hypothetical protein Nepgr_024988 [Nepenthes gracilis]